MPIKTIKIGKAEKTAEAKRHAVGRAIQDVRLTGDRIHVIAYGKEQWGILKEGAERLSKIYDDKSEAVSRAKELALKKSVSAVVLHRRNGMPEKTFNIKSLKLK